VVAKADNCQRDAAWRNSDTVRNNPGGSILAGLASAEAWRGGYLFCS